jgi:chemotaxis protein methyltransferase CheR
MAGPSLPSLADILDLVARISGIRLPDTMYCQVQDFIRERMEQRGLEAAACLGLLERDAGERADFVAAVTIGETYFFRDERQFRMLHDHLLPQLGASGDGQLRLWSAACASGEEAVSLAAMALRHAPRGDPAAVTVWASDLNRHAVRQLELGQFRSSSLRADGSGFHHLLDDCLSACGPQSLQASPELMARIRPCTVNLAELHYPAIPDSLDLIFLRNVLIYIETGLRERIVAAMLAKLRPRGILFLSSAEIPLFNHPDMALREIDGAFFFQKLAPGEQLASRTAGAAAQPAPGFRPVVRPAGSRGPLPPSSPLPATGAPGLLALTARLGHGGGQPEEDGPRGQAARLYLEAAAGINDGGTDRARDCLAKAGSLVGEQDIGWYLEACSRMRDGTTNLAVDGFGRCLELNPLFWPARYHRGILAASRDPDHARREFLKTEKDIQTCLDRDQTDFDFLLEGFNSRYFLGICRKWLQKLSPSEANHGN